MKRGFITQLLALLGYTIGFYMAMVFHRPFSEFVELMIPYPSATLDVQFHYFSGEMTFNLDVSFYRILSFIAIILLAYIVVRTIIFFVQPVTAIDAYPKADKIGGAVVSVLISYIFIFMGLYLATTVPIDFIQNMITNNVVVQFMIENTPILSNMFYELMIGPIL